MRPISDTLRTLRKPPFIVVFVVALLASLIATAILFPDVTYIYLYATAVFAVLLTPLFLWMRLTKSEKKKKWIRRGIFLVLGLPIILAILRIILVIVALFIYFA